jgi:hypothetical protein
MASKKFKNKACAYCGTLGAAQTRDHVFAREFFLLRDRADLPQVPACEHCNNEKSKLETYLLQLLPLGANHGAAVETVRTLMPKRAAHQGNKALHNALQDPKQSIWLVDSDGLWHERTPILLEPIKMLSWCALLARGLAYFHWNESIAPNYEVEVVPLEAEVEREISMMVDRWKVEQTLGRGAFRYRGFNAVDDSSASVWIIEIYGRMPIGGNQKLAASWAIFIKPMQ